MPNFCASNLFHKVPKYKKLVYAIFKFLKNIIFFLCNSFLERSNDIELMEDEGQRKEKSVDLSI